MIQVLIIDFLTVMLSSALIVTRPWMRFSHPAVLYLLFHVLVVTQRGWAVLVAEAPTFFGVPPERIAEAVFAADIMLASLVAGWLIAPRRARLPSCPGGCGWRPLRAQQMLVVTSVAAVLGIVGLVRVGHVPGVEGSVIVRGSYIELAIVWPAVALIALIYRFGARWYLVTPTLIFIAIMAFQGFGRFRLVLPLVLLLLVLLELAGRRWPRPWVLIAAVLLGVLFIPMKTLAFQAQSGTLDWSTLRSEVAASYEEAKVGESQEQQILDQAAIVMLRAEETDHVLLGAPYAKMMIFAVPRSLWPEKPHLGSHLVALSTQGYPIGEVGSVSALLGDLYLNFRWWGLVVGAFLFAVVSGGLFARSYRHSLGCAARLLYLAFAVTLIQVYRDGLISLAIFMMIPLLPVVLICVFSWRPFGRERDARFAHRGMTSAR